MSSSTEKPDIQDLLDLFGDFSLKENQEDIKNTNIGEQVDAARPKQTDVSKKLRHGVNMARLHRLLSKDVSINSGKGIYFKKAASKALQQEKYYSRATEIYDMARSHDGAAKIFPFLALPAELRLDIYFELLVSDDRFTITWHGPKCINKQLQKKIYIDILQTCKLCCNEGLSVLYGENIFDFGRIHDQLDVSKSFINRIGPTNPSLIRIIIGEHSAVGEELSHVAPDDYFSCPLSTCRISSFLSAFNISIDQLRILGLSIQPYERGKESEALIKKQDSSLEVDKEWLQSKNRKENLEKLVNAMCDREKGFRKVDFEDIDKNIRFEWASPFWRRFWIAYDRVMVEEK